MYMLVVLSISCKLLQNNIVTVQLLLHYNQDHWNYHYYHGL